ncbi:hypothetical protein [Halorientalis salina]|uniref:hypothetical protein n=1 Tax=Halorientalis salina TaxID=2932266 RepID=UPI0010AC65B5|nr:hypothetical protein [Halorientalis salina]
MLGNSSPRISLYSFFSVLLPGVVFLLGVIPFLPSKTSLGSLGVLLPILAIGFAVGQAVHTVAVAIESNSSKSEEIKEMMNEATSRREKANLWFKRWFIAEPLRQLFGDQYFENTSHRKRFINELNTNQDGEILDTEVCNSFYEVSRGTFPELNLPESRTDLDENGDTARRFDLLYGNIRSVVHIDGRGRSRSFQAIYSFCRSMWIVSICLFLIYAIYSMLSMIGVLSELASYTSFIGTLDISSRILAPAAFIIAVGSFKLFNTAKQNYQKYYIQYLISDFLILQSDRIASGQQVDLSHSFDEGESE